jgi:hypothetical protein
MLSKPGLSKAAADTGCSGACEGSGGMFNGGEHAQFLICKLNNETSIKQCKVANHQNHLRLQKCTSCVELAHCSPKVEYLNLITNKKLLQRWTGVYFEPLDKVSFYVNLCGTVGY